MATVFTTPLNAVASTVGSAYTAGSGSLVLASGGGSQFGSPSSGSPIRVTCIRASDGAVSILKVTGRSTDTLTVNSVLESTTDINLAIGDRVEMRVSAGYIQDNQTAINNLETSVVNASNLTSGTVGTARLGSGSASSSTFLRGDSSWAAPTTGAGGSSGQLQYNSSGTLTGAASATYATSGTIVTVVQPASTDTPLKLQAAASVTYTDSPLMTMTTSTGTVVSKVYATGAAFFAGGFDETSTLVGVHIGLSSSTPRILFSDGTAAENWQIDNNTGVFRWFTPGNVRMQLATTGLTPYGTTTLTPYASQTNPILSITNSSGTGLSVIDSTGMNFGLGCTVATTWSGVSGLNGSNFQIRDSATNAARMVVNSAGSSPEVHWVAGANAAGDRNFRAYVNGTNWIFDQPVDDYSTTVQLLKLTKDGSVVLGPQSALSTSATAGFTYIPTVAGTPTGTPASQTGTVAMHYDTTANKLWVYNGAWRSVTLT